MRSVSKMRLAALAVGAALVGAAATVACARGGRAGFGTPDEVPYFVGEACEGGTCASSACVTTISGSALAPNGRDPLYAAVVYVPMAPLSPFSEGATCARCDVVSGAPLVSAVTGPDGRFRLEVPPTRPLDLVVQVGKWRRRITLDALVPCADNPVPAERSRLPRTHAEGDIPLHAVTTGNCDRLECVLRKIGVADSEFTLPAAGGRVHLYRENGASIPGIPPADELTGSPSSLARYDVVLFDCAGEQVEKPTAHKQNVVDFTTHGGRLFVSHFSYVWLYAIAPFAATASWNTGAAIPSFDRVPAKLDTSHPRGAAFARWMARVGALASEGDRMIDVLDPRFDALAIFPPAARWIYTDSPPSVQEFTFDTPIGANPSEQCGRVTFGDFHVTGAACTPDGFAFPTECESPSSAMTPQERVMEFMLFDLASCPQSFGPPPVLVR